jgi:hypothetical protein
MVLQSSTGAWGECVPSIRLLHVPCQLQGAGVRGVFKLMMLDAEQAPALSGIS